MHNGTKFQIWNEYFPNQFHQLKNKFGINLGMTHNTPKVIKTKLHNSQWRSKWSTVSPQCWHIMHQSIKSKPLNLKLSPVKILFQVTHQTKKETRLGTLTHTIPRKDNWRRVSQLVRIRSDVKIPIRLQLPS